MSKEKEIIVGDYVLPRKTGLIELGDPPYKVETINEDGTYTIVQKQGSYEHRLTLTRKKINKL